MKYLTNYIEQAHTEALNRAGAFFAFSTSQFNEAKKEGVKYSNLEYGLICPTDNCETLLKELDTTYKAGIKQDIAENGIDNIIIRELANHEAYYTGDTTSTREALADYPITLEQIQSIYNKEAKKKNNY